MLVGRAVVGDKGLGDKGLGLYAMKLRDPLARRLRRRQAYDKEAAIF